MSASIIVVEDEEPIQILLSYNLESEGYRVRSTAQGEDLQRFISEERPDLILMDWMLPGLSGIELCRLLRGRPETGYPDHHADSPQRGGREGAGACNGR